MNSVPDQGSGLLGLSPDQLKSAARWVVATGGSALASWVVAKGFVSKDQAAAILANPDVQNYGVTVIVSVVGAAVSGAGLLWGLITHKKVNMVAAVAALPEVAKIETTPTQAGASLAAAIPPAPGVVVTVAK